jgi:hypothetical protein
MRGSARVDDRALGLEKKPRMRRVVLLMAGLMLFCLGLLLALLATTASEASSGLARADSGHVDGGVLVPLAEDGSYLPTPAEETQETNKRPVNASLLSMLVLAIASSFGASTLWLLRSNPRRRGSEEGRAWSLETDAGPSFLGVFLL